VSHGNASRRSYARPGNDPAGAREPPLPIHRSTRWTLCCFARRATAVSVMGSALAFHAKRQSASAVLDRSLEREGARFARTALRGSATRLVVAGATGAALRAAPAPAVLAPAGRRWGSWLSTRQGDRGGGPQILDRAHRTTPARRVKHDRGPPLSAANRSSEGVQTRWFARICAGGAGRGARGTRRPEAWAGQRP
jgi:hypothetical protein